TATDPGVDVSVARKGGNVVVVNFEPAGGAGLDYASILDDGQEIGLTVDGVDVALGGRPTALETTIGASGLSTTTAITFSGNWATASAAEKAAFYQLLSDKGIKQFRYDITQ